MHHISIQKFMNQKDTVFVLYHSHPACDSEDRKTAFNSTLIQTGKKERQVQLHQFSSVQFSRSVVSDSLRPHESQHARPPCPSPTPGVHSGSRPSSQWCHPAISSSVVPFSSCLQSLPASVFSNESTLRMRWPKYWSFSFSIIPSKEIPGLISFRMDWLDLLASGQIRSVSQSCPSLCNPMNRGTPGLPVHHQLREFTETHVHRVCHAIQPSHPLSSPSPPWTLIVLKSYRANVARFPDTGRRECSQILTPFCFWGQTALHSSILGNFFPFPALSLPFQKSLGECMPSEYHFQLAFSS